MALETWNGRTATQTDGDSPLDQTLMEGIRKDLDHLRQVIYGSTDPNFHTPTWGHTHNGSDSNLITAIGANAVTQSSMADSAIGQAELKTAMGEVLTTALANLTLPGGEYGFYPQVRWNPGTTGTINVQIGNTFSNTSYTTNIYMGRASGDGNAYARQRYIQASPPYNLGNGDIPLFIFAMVNKSTGKVEATYIAEDPPWAYNGPKRIDPRKVFTRKAKKYKGKKYLKRIKRPWPHAEALADKTKLIENLAAAKTPIIEEVEITHALKNAGMPDIPHPFASLDPATHTVVLLDPVSPLCLNLHEMAQSADEGVSEITDLLHKGRIKFDNTAINGLITPPGVMGVTMRLA